MRCSICKKEIKFMQKYYQAERIVWFDKKPFTFLDNAHSGCVRKKRKAQKDGTDDTSNIVYT